MVVFLAWLWGVSKNVKKYVRFYIHSVSARNLIFTGVSTYLMIYYLRDPMTHLAYKRFQKITQKKTLEREEELKQFASDEVFVTMDNQEIKLKEFEDEFVILIKSSNPDKLNKVSKIYNQLKNYQSNSFVVVDNFNNEGAVTSDIGNNAFFVTSTLKSTLLDDSIYLLYPGDQELLLEQKIPDNIQGLTKKLRLRMNKKLDQKYKKSINFSVAQEGKNQQNK